MSKTKQQQKQKRLQRDVDNNCRYTYVFPPKQVVTFTVCFEIYFYRLNLFRPHCWFYYQKMGGGGGTAADVASDNVITI